MSFWKAIPAVLAQAPVGLTNVGSRIYPRKLPRSATLPAIAFFQISGGPAVSHEGLTGSSFGLRWQFSKFAKDIEGGKTASQQLDELNEWLLGALTGRHTVQIGMQARTLTGVPSTGMDDRDPETEMDIHTQDFFLSLD